MSSSTYTFFDIPTKPPRECWSMNTWRTRLVLNYKGLDYKTEWLEYPDIQTRLGPHATPNKGSPKFTCPALQMPDGSYLMDSYKIADVIEQKHPEPSLPLNGPLHSKFQPLLIDFMTQLRPIFVPGVAERFLSERSAEYFRESRGRDVGMDLVVYKEKHGPGAFERAEPFARQISALLNATSSGPFFLGEAVTYTDFIWAAILLFFKKLGDQEYEEVLERSGDAKAHRRLLDAVSLWTKRDD